MKKINQNMMINEQINMQKKAPPQQQEQLAEEEEEVDENQVYLEGLRFQQFLNFGGQQQDSAQEEEDVYPEVRMQKTSNQGS